MYGYLVASWKKMSTSNFVFEADGRQFYEYMRIWHVRILFHGQGIPGQNPFIPFAR